MADTIRTSSSQLSRMMRQLAWGLHREALPRSQTLEHELDQDASLRLQDHDLLRAVKVGKIIAGCGRIMQTSEGHEGDFLLSKPVATIDMFISHSWATPAWLKVCSLMYIMNLKRAFFFGLLVQVLVHALTIRLHSPCLAAERSYLPNGAQEAEIYLQLHFVPACITFLLVFAYGQQVPGLPQQWCFLDKLCIHQTDAAKKQAGIDQLGAFLRRSTRMVVLWQPVYFQRGWCVFELAAFLHMNKGRANITFIPLKLPLCALALNLFHFAATLALAIMLPPTFLSRRHASWTAANIREVAQPFYMFAAWTLMSGFCVYLLPAFLLWRFCKEHSKDRQLLLDQLQRFSWAEARCFALSDRMFICGAIERWFGSVAAFERYVRKELSREVTALLVQQGPMPYHCVLAGSIPHTFFAAMAIVLAFQHGEGQVAWHMVCSGIGITLFTDAIAMNLTVRLASTSFGDFAEGRSCRSRYLAGPVATSLLFALSNAIVGGFLMMPVVPLWVCQILLFIEGAITCLLYRGKAPVGAVAAVQELSDVLPLGSSLAASTRDAGSPSSASWRSGIAEGLAASATWSGSIAEGVAEEHMLVLPMPRPFEERSLRLIPGN